MTKQEPLEDIEYTCEKCFHKGPDVHEQPTHLFGRDTYRYLCDDHNACYDRITAYFESLEVSRMANR